VRGRDEKNKGREEEGEKDNFLINTSFTILREERKGRGRGREG
jgi:hypothetical protein